MAILEYKYKWKYAYYIGFVMLTLMLCLRYGQGTDYFGYLRNYHVSDNHSEVGYQALCKVLQLLKIRYEYLNAFIGLVTMLCFDRAIKRYSTWKNFTLLLIYPTVFLTYCFSATRQGLVIAFFSGFMVKWLENGKWIKYLMACFALATFHISAIVLIPIVLIRKVSLKKIYIVMVLCVVRGVLLYCMPTELAQLVPSFRVRQYFGTHSVSVLGLIERCTMMLGIGILWNFVYKKESIVPKRELLIYKIYIYGFSLSMLLMTWSLMSSRMSAPMKALEVFLLTMLITKMSNAAYVIVKKLAIVALVSYIFIMTTKNLYTYIQQSKPFYDAYTPITYPYINIINKYDYMDIWFRNKSYRNFVIIRDTKKDELSFSQIY